MNSLLIKTSKPIKSTRRCPGNDPKAVLQGAAVFTGASRPGKRHVGENFVVANPKVTADNWDGGVQFDDVQSEAQTEALIEKVRPTAPISAPPITQQSAEEACELVLAQAGATLPKRDAVHARIIQSGLTRVMPVLSQRRPMMSWLNDF